MAEIFSDFCHGGGADNSQVLLIIAKQNLGLFSTVVAVAMVSLPTFGNSSSLLSSWLGSGEVMM